MDLVPYLSTLILIATMATILFAVLSYGVFKLRDRRRPKSTGKGPVFFREFVLEETPVEEGDGDDGETPRSED